MHDLTYLYFPCIDINKMISLMWKDHIDILPPYKIIFNNYRNFIWNIENKLWKKIISNTNSEKRNDEIYQKH